MNDDLKSLLEEARHPVRSQALISIVNALEDVGYEEKFFSFTQEILGSHDSSMDAIDKVEGFIFACARSLLDKLGVMYDFNVMYNRPVHLSHIITGLLGDIEAWDDYETLLAIVDSGEPGGIMLGNVISHMTAHPASCYHEIVMDILPQTHRAIRGALIANQIEDQDNEGRVSPEIIENLVNFIKRFPHSQATHVLGNYGYTKPMAELLSLCHVEYDTSRPDNYSKDVGIAAAGLLLTVYSTYDDAYNSDISRIVEMLVDDGHRTHVIPSVKAAALALQTVFGMREETDETS